MLFHPFYSVHFHFHFVSFPHVIELQSNGEINLNRMIMPVLELVVSFLLVFISCELIGRINYGFEAIGNIQHEWYLFPSNVQKMLPLILLYAQQPVNINCFGSIPCNRETFKKVGTGQIFSWPMRS